MGVIDSANMGGGTPFQELQKKYGNFVYPRACLLIGGKEFDSVKAGVAVNDIHIELTSHFEASIATFRLYGAFNRKEGFTFQAVSKQVVMGNSVEIKLGYLNRLETVFVGFICGLDFGQDTIRPAYIEVTAMDVKGLMMGGSYATALTATTYSAAVEEILRRTGQGHLQSAGGITEIRVSRTPDASGGAPARVSPPPGSPSVSAGSLSSDVPGAPGEAPAPAPAPKSSPLSVEMVGESDYEFVVRAAKRYNFEFFVDRGAVIFRPAKDDSNVYLTLEPDCLTSYNVGYSITSVVGEIQARAMDAGTGKLISAGKKFKNKISTQNKAQKLVGKGVKVYVDPSITSTEEAEARVAALMEQMSYRLGSLEAETVGVPELLPGRFVKISGMGKPVNNVFYIDRVCHDFTDDGGYHARIEGCAASVKK